MPLSLLSSPEKPGTSILTTVPVLPLIEHVAQHAEPHDRDPEQKGEHRTYTSACHHIPPRLLSSLTNAWVGAVFPDSTDATLGSA